MLSQVELEEQSSVHSIARANGMMTRNEETGQAQNNPYAQAIYRKYLLPLEEVIDKEVKSLGKAGRRAAHVALLKGLDPQAVALIATRVALTSVMGGAGNIRARPMATALGRFVYQELVLSLFQLGSPNLYYTVMMDLDRRNSKNLRHRTYVMQMEAQKAEVELPVWSADDKQQLGLWLLEQLRLIGMIDIIRSVNIKNHGRNIKHEFTVVLTDEAMDLVASIKDFITMTMPYHVPFVEQPKDWTAVDEGGYHTDTMRRYMPYMISNRRHVDTSTIDKLKTYDLSRIFKTLNKLQSVKWQVNGEMLDTIMTVANHFDMEEIITQAELPKPHKPFWLSDSVDKANMDEGQLVEFGTWKRSMADWYTAMKLRGPKWGRFYTTTRMAKQFREREQIYFLYQCDFRGRYYAISNGLTPQGSDLQKSLLRVKNGKPLTTERDVFWFKLHGANKFGIDKESLEFRVQWTEEHSEMIIACANDPINNRAWTEADSPLQFLAWAKEYASWVRDPVNFTNHLNIGLDGSCNGLQHFSAALRDPIGGAAVNLTPSHKPNDIYAQVALVVMRKLNEMEEDEAGYRTKWLQHGVNRTLVKRSVMTLPYGSTRYSCQDFIIDDYLKRGKAPEFSKDQYNRAANFLSHIVWDSIGDVVVAARAAMDWLQTSADTIIKAGHPQIEWVTPTGFPVIQVYQKGEIHRINSCLLGKVKLRVNRATEVASKKDHRNGLAPNFVHSLDASAMCLTVNAAHDAGIESLACIHDDFGTLAADTEKFYNIIREQFVKMYEENDPLYQLYERYKDILKEPPPKGTLDLNQVLCSKYFFS